MASTFKILRGVTTNRVRALPARKVNPSPQAALRAYRHDPTLRGKDYTVISIGLPVEDLHAIDLAAAELGMSRSHFVRHMCTKHKTGIAP